jgi:demethylmacrocin O-methyltransferase
MSELCELAIKYGTDKWPWHHYTPHYHELLKDRREQVKKVLEIGIGDVPGMSNTIPNYLPGASLRMWAEYFPNAEIYAIDNMANLLINDGRIHSFFADQGDERSMRRVLPELGSDFDLIVDDGSHVPEHQVSSAKMLVPFLAPNGFYIIEDVWPYPSTVGWSAEPFGTKLSDIPYPAKLIQCGDNPNSDDHLVVIKR